MSNPRICPKCSKQFPHGRMRCNAEPKCETVTVEVIVPVIETPIEVPIEPPDLDIDSDGILGRAGEIMDLVTAKGPLTYKQLAKELDLPYKRIVRLVSQMVRDGIDITRDGKPRTVSL